MHVWGHACAYTDLMIAAPVLKLSQLYCLSLPLPLGSQKLTVKATAGAQAVMAMAEDHTACGMAAALTDGKAEAAVLAKVEMRLEMQTPETVAVVMEVTMGVAVMVAWETGVVPKDLGMVVVMSAVVSTRVPLQMDPEARM